MNRYEREQQREADLNDAYYNDAEPEVDDSVSCCPWCETPNQFGETCAICLREMQTEELINTWVKEWKAENKNLV